MARVWGIGIMSVPCGNSSRIAGQRGRTSPQSRWSSGVWGWELLTIHRCNIVDKRMRARVCVFVCVCVRPPRLGRSNKLLFWGVFCPQYRGQVNLHVFEDWCGASINQLRKNIHFPLYPHTRTSVNKIAVAPKWKNYGLRIFGYIHPYKDGDFQFAIASDDNSELWLSPDEVPVRISISLGTEWAAPGEFTKFRSQVSNPIHMIATKRYYFEALHKQDDKGSDHVEVGWRLFLPGLKFEVIDSLHISLYADESSLKMNRVDHIPQTLASHSGGRLMLQRELHAADMLKPDPRDTFFLTPAIAPSRIANLLPPCSYLPTYVVKDFPIARYQGLQFVYLSFVYPNDFTRLTHMETENKCFYRESPMYLERFGFYKYMKMDEEENRPFWFDNPEGEIMSDVPIVQLHHSLMTHSQCFTCFSPPPPSPIAVLSALRLNRTPPLTAHEGASPRGALSGTAWPTGKPESPGGPSSPQGGRRRREGVPDYSYEDTEPRPPWAEEAVNWQRTFSVGSVDFELLRSDWNDLRCNVSGNLQLAESEVVEVLAQYMERLNARSGGMYTLLRIINMEKRRDSARGNRYLIEVELMERGQRVVRVSQYIYLLLHRTKQDEGIEANQGTPEFEVKEPSAPSVPYSKPVLCQPIGLQWRDDVMVHFVVPVKNQARWVQQFITDMEHLYKATKDESFNIIIIDFESGDMDVEQALKASSVPRYQYLKRSGSFERSAGLQAGADLIEDSHTILFLCDLHIHFPISILDNIRKHCLEGRLAYAPIVMRLGCGSSPSEPDGYWEVNGFGLFGIFKSDFDKVGGMNTEEFRDRWGGEDWELLDRVLQSGLEVERLRLRNFYHYYHSKRGMWDSQTTDTTKGASER
uniref:Beta-1,4-N-acetylgalactosaminyltransferase n=1 Tax=Callorhinchus milii TaxID=7868 RepID=A0A4W3HPS5_CALMI